MKDIVWSKILSVGVAEIDDDHRLLIALFNELNRAVAAGDSAEYQLSLIHISEPTRPY